MSLLPLRCLTALGSLWLWAAAEASAGTAWSASFPSDNGVSVSSAFVVGDGRHVVTVALSGAHAEKGKVLSDRRELPSEAFLDPVSRLVVFRLSGPPGESMALLPGVPWTVGTTVHAANGSSGKSAGWVKQVEGKILPLALLKIEYTGAAPPPGTPLTDASGRVIAVAHQSTTGNTGYAVSAEVVKRVLEDIQRGGRMARGWIGLHLQPEATVPRITQVQAGSPSAQAGVKAGDVLLEIGSRQLSDYADAVNAFYFLRPGVVTPVRVKRGNQEMVLPVRPVERRPD